MGLYRNSIFQGGWFSFNSTKENWNKISKEMYDYFLERNIEVRILSNTNPADERFKRIIFEEI